MKQEIQSYPMNLLIDLDSLRASHELSNWELADLSIGYDDCIYLLLEKPEFPIDPQPKQPHTSDYKGLILTVDWQTGELLEYRLVDFGNRKESFHFFQPLGEKLLLAGARCHLYKTGEADQNAVVFDRMGNQTDRFCIGDGIERCMTDSAGNIIASYFDEGIFGNLGWDMSDPSSKPLGKSGLVYWSCEGQKLWENTECDICDCYACNLDAEERLWYYYYIDFDLVCTDYQTVTSFQTEIGGSNAFLIGKGPQRSFLFQGGYGEKDRFYTMQQEGETLSKPRPCILLGENGKSISGQSLCFYQSKAAIMDKERRIWIMDWSGVEKEKTA